MFVCGPMNGCCIISFSFKLDPGCSLQDVDEKLLYDTFSAFGVIVTNPKVMPLLIFPFLEYTHKYVCMYITSSTLTSCHPIPLTFLLLRYLKVQLILLQYDFLTSWFMDIIVSVMFWVQEYLNACCRFKAFIIQLSSLWCMLA